LNRGGAKKGFFTIFKLSLLRVRKNY